MILPYTYYFSDIAQAEVPAYHCRKRLRCCEGTDDFRFIKDHRLEIKAQEYAAAEEFLKFQPANERDIVQ